MNTASKQPYSKLTASLSKEGWLLFLLPFFLLLVNPGLFVSNAFHSKVDSWIYYGYYLNLPQHLTLFTDHHGYFGDRLAFIVPGYLVNRILPPVPADFVLHLVYYYTAIVSLYSLLKLTLDKKVALFTSLLFGAYYYNLWMYSWNVMDGAVNVFFLLTMLFFMKAGTGRRRKTSAALSGFFFTCMLYTSVQAVKLAPAMALFFIVMLYLSRKERSRSVREIGVVIACCVLGTLGANIFFSAINYVLTGDFHVLRQSFEFARWAFEEYEAPLPITFEEVSRAYWLILPLLVVVASPFVLLSRGIRKSAHANRFEILYCICFLAILIPFYLTKIKSSQYGIMMMAPCQFSYVNGSLFLAIGGLVSILTRTLGRKQFVILTALCLAVFIAPSAYLRPHQRGQPRGPALIANAMSVIKEVDPEGRVHFIFNAPGKDLVNTCGNPNFTMAGSQEDLTELYHNIASTYLWAQGKRLLSDKVTEITNDWALSDLRRSDKILVLTNDDGEVSLAQQTLAGYGIRTRPDVERLILKEGIFFKMVFLKIE